MHQLTEERIIIARYDYYGDPRRLVQIDGAINQNHSPSELLDIVAQRAQHTVLVFAEASAFFDATGRPHRWVATLREWGRIVLLTPRPPELWDEAEQEIEREGIPVIPALSQGLEIFAEQLKLGPNLPVASWRPDDGTAASSRRFDLAIGLESHRSMLTDDESPPGVIVDELLADLRVSLGQETFLLLQSLAVFPRLEPALTMYLGASLFLNGQPLLNETRLLTISRLPWLRIGSMPEWMRRALVQRLDKARLEEVLLLLQSFLQPVVNPQTGVLTLEIGRRRAKGFRDILLQWIRSNPIDDLDDRILIDALNGRDPSQLGVPVPVSLARRLKTLFYGTEWAAATLALVAAGFVALLHASIMNVLGEALDRVTRFLAPLIRWPDAIGLDPDYLAVSAWGLLAVAVIVWLNRPHDATRRWLRLMPSALVIAGFLAGIGNFRSSSMTPFALASIIALALFALSSRWTVSENAPRMRLFGDRAPLALELPLVAIWLIVPGFAASQFSIHDMFLGHYLAWFEAGSIACAALFVFCKTRFYPVASRCSLTDAWRIAITFGLGQSLLPLFLVGTTLLASDSVRAETGHTVLANLAFTLPRILSGMVFLEAAFGTGNRGRLWVWPAVMIYAYRFSLALFVPQLANSILRAFRLELLGIPSDNLSNFLPEASFIAYSVVLTGLLWARKPSAPISVGWIKRAAVEIARLQMMVAPAAVCAAAWLGLTAWFDTRTPNPAVIPVVLIALISYLAIQVTLRFRWPYIEFEPVRRTLRLGEIIDEFRARLAGWMPWPLVPLLWLAGVSYRAPFNELSIDLTSLLLPTAVWLAYRYPARAMTTLAVGCLPLLFSIRLGQVVFDGDMGSCAASLLVAKVVMDRQILKEIFDANSTTATQMFVLLVLVGTGIYFSGTSFSFSWGFLSLVYIILFFIGLSRIRIGLLSAVLVVLAFGGPPAFRFLFGLGYPSSVYVYGFVSHPAPVLGGLLIVHFGRLARPVLIGLLDGGSTGTAGSANAVFLAACAALLALISTYFGYRVGSTTYNSLIDSKAVYCALFGIGLRYGRTWVPMFAVAAIFGIAELFDFGISFVRNLAIPTIFDVGLELSRHNRFSAWTLLTPFVIAGVYTVLGMRMREELMQRAQSDGAAERKPVQRAA
jgi:hypothetical protein